MSEEYPAFVEPLSPYCLVRARVASVHADGPDDGSNPDWKPAVGQKVVFTPSISNQLLTYDAGTDDSIIVTVEPVEATTNAEGWFVSNSGKRIYLLATDDPRLSATGWTWSVNFNRRDIRFSAPSGGIVDLASFIVTPAVNATEYVSVKQVVADYLTANPPDVEQAVADYLTTNPPASAPDATTSTKGILQLAGDLGGTADAPIVPGLADKADDNHTHVLADVTDYFPPDLSDYATTTALASGLSGKSDTDHNHDDTYAPALGPDDNYVTDAEKVALHSHTNQAALDEVSGVNTGDQDLSGYATTASLADVATSGAYADLTGTPTIPSAPDDIGAAPATHDHTAADIDSGAAADGHVLTSDGSGGAGWGAPPAGGGGPILQGGPVSGSLLIQPVPLHGASSGDLNGHTSFVNYPILHPVTIDALAVRTTGTKEGATVQIALYDSTPEGFPGSRVALTAEMPAESPNLVTGLLETPLLLEPGLYWTAVHGKDGWVGVGATFQVNSGGAGIHAPVGWYRSSDPHQYNSYRIGYNISGPPPETFPPSGVTGGARSSAFAWVRAL